MRTELCVLIVAALMLVCAVGARAEERAAQQNIDAPAMKEIVLGCSTALEGPARELGQRMVQGMRAAFAECGRDGVVLDDGRVVKLPPIRLEVLDDGYEPSRAGPNVRDLIEKHHVLAIVGNVGTPTAVVTAPIAGQAGVPFVGAYTGAGILRRSPPDKHVFNFRASYDEEVRAMIDTLLGSGGIKAEEIAFFTQRDAFGDAGWTAGLAALAANAVPKDAAITHARYERNTMDVEGAVADMLSAPVRPRAVVMVGTYAPCAKFVRLCDQAGFTPMFFSVSFVGSEALAKALGDTKQSVLVTQVVPTLDTDMPAVKRYKAAMTQGGESQDATLTGLEGYLTGRMTVRALASAMPALSGASVRVREQRAALCSAFEGLGEFDLGIGRDMRLNPVRHQASKEIWLSCVRDGSVRAYEWKTVAAFAAGAKDLKDTRAGERTKEAAHVDP